MNQHGMFTEVADQEAAGVNGGGRRRYCNGSWSCWFLGCDCPQWWGDCPQRPVDRLTFDFEPTTQPTTQPAN